MSEQTNLDIMRAAYEAFGKGDIPAILAINHPQIELESAGPAGLPWAGSHRGIDGAQKYFDAIGNEADILKFQPQAFMAQGDTVVVLGEETLRSKRTGRRYDTHFAHVFTLAAGKIVKFREYCDTAAAAAAFR